MSDSWIGGDIAGLKAMGAQMASAPTKMTSIVTELSSQTDGLVGDSGFSGDAANAFKRRWTEDAITAGALASVVGDAGKTLEELGGHLSSLETQLHSAATTARRAGVPVDAKGQLPTAIAPGATTVMSAAETKAVQTYAADYIELMRLAKGFRLAAADTLGALTRRVAPPSTGSPLTPDQAVTVGDFVKSLYVIPDEKNRADAERLPDELKDAKARLQTASREFSAETAQYRADGKKVPKTTAAKDAQNAASREYKGLRDELAFAENDGGRVAGKALDYSVTDLAKALPDVARATAVLPDFLKFAEDIPVIDIAASAIATGFQIKDDEDKGWSPGQAISKDGTSGLVGLAAGAGVVALAATSEVTVPVAVVVAGAGIAVVGVGDLVYQGFHEHWAEDIHNDGVVPGLLDGSGHVLANTGKDIGHMATSVFHGGESLVKKIWHNPF